MTTAALDLPEKRAYRLKRLLLGKPLVTEALHEERLTKKAALGVLSSDCISSAAYGTEEMLIILLPVFGLTGFHLLMPVTAVILALLIVTTLSYREVVSIYTRAGGSYVVARENFGPKIAQIAAVALLIDYIVTVAVQAAAGVAAIVSIFPAASFGTSTLTLITIGIVLLLAYGNLRGIREAGRAFAFPTYFFVASAGLVVLVGVMRRLVGDLPTIGYSGHDRAHELIDVTNGHHALFTFGAVYVLMKAFANGGASLTGLEAISNGVSVFKRPESRNARRTLTAMSVILGSLVLGISFLAWQTHATPYERGYPTVIAQVARAVFGHDAIGTVGYVIVQVATALILITGANTPFTGFPFLASFVAEDSFLPRQLTRRGHRLAFSSGILVLTALSTALLLGVGAHVDKLIPFYAIGVFTGFTMAGLGMAHHHRAHRSPGWPRRFAINLTSGVLSALVVLIFAVVKFREGAWLVVLLFPILWTVLMRLNAQYRKEARSLDLATWVRQDQAEAAHYGRHSVLVMVDELDLATLRALRYAGSLRPTEIRAVHVVLDGQRAQQLQQDWLARGLSDRFALELVECPDRRLVRTVCELALDVVIGDRSEVTVLLPRRTFRRVSQRLLHDRTADRIAEAVGRIPHVAATIVPFDTTLPHEVIELIEQRQRDIAAEPALAVKSAPAKAECRVRPDGTTPISVAGVHEKVTVQGRIKTVQLGASAGRSLEVQIFDETGGLRLLFIGREQIAGLEPGVLVRASGRVGEYRGHLALANPRYQLVAKPVSA